MIQIFNVCTIESVNFSFILNVLQYLYCDQTPKFEVYTYLRECSQDC